MSTRRNSKQVRVAAAAAIGAFTLNRLLRRRSAALHAAATSLDDTVSAPGTHDERFVPTTVDPAAHAPGHRHLSPRGIASELMAVAPQLAFPRAPRRPYRPLPPRLRIEATR
jgi:hypothetical protein